MSEMNAFAGNPSASRWVTTNPTPGVIRNTVRTNKRTQLLQEAASLVPSAQDLIDRLTKHKLSPGDQNFFQTILGGHMTDYIGKYTENPYFAFSREGKEKVRTMQSIVNNPLLSEAAISFDKSAKTAEIAARERNDNNLNVIGGTISVYDRSSGKIKRVLPDHLGDNMIPLTFNSELEERTKKGFFNQDDGTVDGPVGYNQVSYKEVLDGINAITANLGTTEYETFAKEISDLNSRISTTYRSNASQIQTKLKAIFTKNGQSLLPEAYMDTLLAKEYANQYNQKKSIDRNEAYQNVAKEIESMVLGKQSTSVTHQESALSKAQGSAANAQMTQIGPWESILLNWTNKPADVRIKRNGKEFAVQGSELNPALFGAYEENGVKTGILPLNMNGMYKDILKHSGSPLTTTDDIKINPAYTIPAENPNIVVYNDPLDPSKQWMEFDVYTTDDHAGTNVEDTKEGKSALTDDERSYWESVGKYTKELYDSKKVLSDFRGYESEQTFWDEDQYKVRAKVQYDPDASLKAKFIADQKGQHIDKRATTVQPSITRPRIEAD